MTWKQLARKLPIPILGATVGVASALVATLLVPSDVSVPEDYMNRYWVRLGWIVLPASAAWCGWSLTSVGRAGVGLLIGILLSVAGTVMAVKSTNRVVISHVFWFSCVAGPSMTLCWWAPGEGAKVVALRALRGLLAGFALGAALWIALITHGLLKPDKTWDMYSHGHISAEECMRWLMPHVRRSGAIAGGVAGALFFSLILWAVRPGRQR